MKDEYIKIAKSAFLKVKGSNVELYMPLRVQDKKLFFSFRDGLLLPRVHYYTVKRALMECSLSYMFLENEVRKIMSNNIYNIMEDL